MIYITSIKRIFFSPQDLSRKSVSKCHSMLWFLLFISKISPGVCWKQKFPTQLDVSVWVFYFIVFGFHTHSLGSCWWNVLENHQMLKKVNKNTKLKCSDFILRKGDYCRVNLYDNLPFIKSLTVIKMPPKFMFQYWDVFWEARSWHERKRELLLCFCS